MIDLEKKLVTKVSEWCKKLRTSSSYRQDDIADKASAPVVAKKTLPRIKIPFLLSGLNRTLKA